MLTSVHRNYQMCIQAIICPYQLWSTQLSSEMLSLNFHGLLNGCTKGPLWSVVDLNGQCETGKHTLCVNCNEDVDSSLTRKYLTSVGKQAVKCPNKLYQMKER
jgi:hypothetical protein